MIVADGSGGVVVTWWDERSDEGDIYAQRVNASGVTQWTTDGIGICSAPERQRYPTIVSDGASGAIVVWEDNRPGDYLDIYAQRVSAGGAMQWTTNGVVICTAPNRQSSPRALADGAGGAFVCWDDARAYPLYNLYAQRVSASGVMQWMENGLNVRPSPVTQYQGTWCRDGVGGAILCWHGYGDLYAQRFSMAGVRLWADDAVPVCTATGAQYYQKLALNGTSGAICSWNDYRPTNNTEVYAQRLVNGATASNFVAYTDSIAGGDYFKYQYKARAKWTTDLSATSRVQYRVLGNSIWSQTTESASPATTHIRVVSGLADNTTYELRPLNYSAGVPTYGAIDTVTTYSADIAISSFSFSQAAAPPYGVTATFSFTTSANSSCRVNSRKEQSPAVSWSTDEVSESSLHGTSHSHDIGGLNYNTLYQAYIQVFPSASFGGEDTVYPDGAVPQSTATTVSIRFLTPTKQGQGGWYEQQTSRVGLPPTTSLGNNYPNPFNPSTTIEFDIAESGVDIEVAVFNVQGQRVRSLVMGPHPSGQYRIEWDGRDESGRAVASGIYLLKMSAGGKQYVRKMSLLK